MNDNIESNECIICFNDIELDEINIVLPCRCQYIYHYKCIIEWLNINSSCPHCRKKITKNDIVSFLYENYNIDLGYYHTEQLEQSEQSPIINQQPDENIELVYNNNNKYRYYFCFILFLILIIILSTL